MRRVAILFCVVSILSGCTYISLSVTKMVDKGNFRVGKVFYIDEKLSANIEKRKYAKRIQNILIRHGYKVSAKKSHAEYLLKFSYGVDGGKTYYRDRWAYYGNTFGYAGQEAYVAYTRFLKIAIYENSTSKQIFTVNVRNKGSIDTFSIVAKCLIKSALENFPGETGYRELSVDIENNCKKQ